MKAMRLFSVRISVRIMDFGLRSGRNKFFFACSSDRNCSKWTVQAHDGCTLNSICRRPFEVRPSLGTKTRPHLLGKPIQLERKSESYTQSPENFSLKVISHHKYSEKHNRFLNILNPMQSSFSSNMSAKIADVVRQKALVVLINIFEHMWHGRGPSTNTLLEGT